MFSSYILAKGCEYMKKVIPFKKELPFKTKISEITSISLEHTLNLKEDDLISGTFYVTGEYKMTETSINKEQFSYDIPFDIALDSRFDINNIVIDIDDFYYDIINNDTLKVNIDVFIEGAELEEENRCETDEVGRCIEEEDVEEEVENKPDIENNIVYQEIEKEELPIVERKDNMNEINIENENENNNINLFDNFDGKETYSTYLVYIVKEDDTIESILEKFKITKEELLNYNDIVEIKPNDKLIIPTSNE